MSYSDYNGKQINIRWDDSKRSFNIDCNGVAVGDAPFTDPACGFGGGEWIVDEESGILIWSYYSGQSQQAWTIICIKEGSIKLVINSEYEDGETASFAISNVRNSVYIFVPVVCSGYFEYFLDACDPQIESNEMYSYKYADIYVVSTEDGKTEKSQLRMSMRRDGEFAEHDYDPIMYPSVDEEGNWLHVSLPWGQEQFRLPLQPQVYSNNNLTR